MILLDTDVLVDVLRGYEPALAWLTAAFNVKHYSVLEELKAIQPYGK